MRPEPSGQRVNVSRVVIALEFRRSLALAAGLSTLCLAKAPVTRTRVTITHLKPDMVNRMDRFAEE